jgi:phospholipid transport system substrate-binding protein
MTMRVLNQAVAVFLALIFSFNMSTVFADDAMPEPQAIVKEASDKMLQALKDNKEELDKNPSHIFSLVEAILMPNFDFDRMSKLALGKNWRQADKQQQAQFTEEFRLLLIRTYSTAMMEYSDQEIRFLPMKGDLSNKKTKVDMEIIQVGGPSIPMSLSMYQNKADKWKAYDVRIDGISLVTNYRSTFSTEIRNKGMDQLITDLAKRNEQIKQ